MNNIRQQIEHGFGRFGRWIFNHRIKTLVFMLLVIAGFFSQLPNITIDTSSEGFLHEDDPILEAYNEFRSQFGRDETVMLAIKTDSVFEDDFLKKLKALHDELEEKTPYLDDITSLINVRNTRGEGDRLIVEDLFEDWPQNAEQMREKAELAGNSELYRNFLLSEEADFTAIIIQSSAFATEQVAEDDLMAGFEDEALSIEQPTETPPQYLTDQQNSEMVTVIRQVMKQYQSEDFPIYIAGSPAVVDAIKRAMQHDMQTFTKGALLTIAIVLFVLFRRLSGVFMPLVIVIFSLLSTFASMAATGTPIKLPTQILPSFLLAVGIAASVHLLAIFYRHYDKHGDKGDAISHAMGHSGLAIAMTSLTSAAGLLSFSASEVAPIADLGRFASAGVMISLLYTLILLPALVSLFPMKQKSKGLSQHGGAMDSILNGFASFSVKHHKPILGFTLILFVVAIGGALQSKFYHNPLEWMPKEWDTRQATDLLDVEMKGTGVTEVVLKTNVENGLYEPKLISKLEDFEQRIKSASYEDIFIGKTSSVLDILRESNRALHANDQAYYKAPEDRDLIAQELFLFENSGSDDLEDFVDTQFSMARFTIKTPWVDAASHSDFIAQLEEQLAHTMGEVDYYVTGMGSLFARTMNAAIDSTKISYLIAAAVITVMMIILLGSFKLGLISMVPNFLPILISIGAMGYFGMPFDMFTMLIGSIAIGLVVDDTIHFMHNFRRYHQQSNDVAWAVRETLLSTGRAIAVTTVVLSMGFYVFMAASMENVFNFGFITGSTIVLALLADLVLAPALMAFIYRHKTTA